MLLFSLTPYMSYVTVIPFYLCPPLFSKPAEYKLQYVIGFLVDFEEISIPLIILFYILFHPLVIRIFNSAIVRRIINSLDYISLVFLNLLKKQIPSYYSIKNSYVVKKFYSLVI